MSIKKIKDELEYLLMAYMSFFDIAYEDGSIEPDGSTLELTAVISDCNIPFTTAIRLRYNPEYQGVEVEVCEDDYEALDGEALFRTLFFDALYQINRMSNNIATENVLINRGELKWQKALQKEMEAAAEQEAIAVAVDVKLLVKQGSKNDQAWNKD